MKWWILYLELSFLPVPSYRTITIVRESWGLFSVFMLILIFKGYFTLFLSSLACNNDWKYLWGEEQTNFFLKISYIVWSLKLKKIKNDSKKKWWIQVNNSVLGHIDLLVSLSCHGCSVAHILKRMSENHCFCCSHSFPPQILRLY